jgi:hypothetical protein
MSALYIIVLVYTRINLSTGQVSCNTQVQKFVTVVERMTLPYKDNTAKNYHRKLYHMNKYKPDHEIFSPINLSAIRCLKI